MGGWPFVVRVGLYPHRDGGLYQMHSCVLPMRRSVLVVGDEDA